MRAKMTEDRKRKSAVRRCPPIGALAANLPGTSARPPLGSYWEPTLPAKMTEGLAFAATAEMLSNVTPTA
jgi:hypothetical protein